MTILEKIEVFASKGRLRSLTELTEAQLLWLLRANNRTLFELEQNNQRLPPWAVDLTKERTAIVLELAERGVIVRGDEV